MQTMPDASSAVGASLGVRDRVPQITRLPRNRNVQICRRVFQGPQMDPLVVRVYDSIVIYRCG